MSFRIEEDRNTQYSKFIKRIGNLLVVGNYFDDAIQKNPQLKSKDSVYYFKARIDIGMNFFDTSRQQFLEKGYGFIVNNEFIEFGNLSVGNYLQQIIPDDNKVLKNFHDAYLKNGYTPPAWLSELLKRRQARSKIYMNK